MGAKKNKSKQPKDAESLHRQASQGKPQNCYMSLPDEDSNLRIAGAKLELHTIKGFR